MALATLLLMAAVAYLGVSRIGEAGGGGGEGDAPSTTTITPVAAESVLVRVRANGETRVAMLLAPQTAPTMIVALPGDTLVRASSGFERLVTFLDADSDMDEALEEAANGLEDLVGVKPASVASVEWADVVKALAKIDAAGSPREELAADQKGSADAVATAFERLAKESAGGAGEEALNHLALEGAADSVRVALRALAGGAGVTGGIPGRVVEGLGFAYFEPDPAALQAMLGGQPPESTVSVEVQNGSGEVGAAQKVAEAIAPFGYTALPPKNAEGFPDVETTQIFAAPDVVGEADRLRTAVGLGTVVQQDTLPPGRIVIVVGKDLDADALPGVGG
ncbi:MAG: LytR C-terminal domain-containing protein [Thermoleophilia bacterium]